VASRDGRGTSTFLALSFVALCASTSLASGAITFINHTPAIPQDAIYVAPSVSATHAKYVQGLIEAAPEGQAFVFKAGTHFLGELKPKHNQQFYGQVVNGQLATILTGANTIAPADWTCDRPNRVYMLTGQTQSDKKTAVMPSAKGGLMPMTLKPNHRVSFRYDVFRNDKFLRHATVGADWPDHTPSDLSKIAPGSFFFDYGNDVIYLKDDPHKPGAEIKVMYYECAFWCGDAVVDRNRANGVNVKNLVFEKYATFVNEGAVRAQGDNWFIEDNEFRQNHGCGISSGIIKAYPPGRRPDKMPADIANYPSGAIVRRNYCHDNGGAGIQVYAAHNVLVEKNEVCYNNWFNWKSGMTSGPDSNFGYKLHWEASGIKVIYYGHDTTVRGNYIHDENCTGIWVDVEVQNTVVEDNVIKNTMLSGICVEIAKNTTVRNNTLICNGTGNGAGEYCAQITLDETWPCKVYGNSMQAASDSGDTSAKSLVGIIWVPRRETEGVTFSGHEIFGNKANILKTLSPVYGGIFFNAKNVSPDLERRNFTENKVFRNKYYIGPSVTARNDYVVEDLAEAELNHNAVPFECVQFFGQELQSEAVTAPHVIDQKWNYSPSAAVGDTPTVITPSGRSAFYSLLPTPTLIGTCKGSTTKDLKVSVNGKPYTVPSVYSDELPRDADGRVYHNMHSGLWSLTIPGTDRLKDGQYTVRVEANRKDNNSVLWQEYTLIVAADPFPVPDNTLDAVGQITDRAPTIAGNYEPDEIGGVCVLLNGKYYSDMSTLGRVILDPGQRKWSLAIPGAHELAPGIYDVTVSLVKKSGQFAKRTFAEHLTITALPQVPERLLKDPARAIPVH
jgi:parallel beta-helix repeat protein